MGDFGNPCYDIPTYIFVVFLERVQQSYSSMHQSYSSIHQIAVLRGYLGVTQGVLRCYLGGTEVLLRGTQGYLGGTIENYTVVLPQKTIVIENQTYSSTVVSSFVLPYTDTLFNYLYIRYLGTPRYLRSNLGRLSSSSPSY